MSWSSGSRMMGEIIQAVTEAGINNRKRIAIYEILIPVFEDNDCDTLYECMGDDPSFDTAYRGFHKEED
jgi:hypothetical protein